MSKYKAVLFDLDDTLLNRHDAVDNMFSLVVETCYGDLGEEIKDDMHQSFRNNDRKLYGHDDKSQLLESLFDEFPPKKKINRGDIQSFWNVNFPKCFSIDPNVMKILSDIKKHAKLAIITNGSIQRQDAKMRNTNILSLFDAVIISEEVGLNKPDKRIFELALNRLNVSPDEVIFVGDDLTKDIAGSQSAEIKGVWFNPLNLKNETLISPDLEIRSLDEVLEFFKR